jgi:hypothetical protein
MESGGWGGSGDETVALAEALDDRADLEAAVLRREGERQWAELGSGAQGARRA